MSFRAINGKKMVIQNLVKTFVIIEISKRIIDFDNISKVFLKVTSVDLHNTIQWFCKTNNMYNH